MALFDLQLSCVLVNVQYMLVFVIICESHNSLAIEFRMCIKDSVCTYLMAVHTFHVNGTLNVHSSDTYLGSHLHDSWPLSSESLLFLL